MCGKIHAKNRLFHYIPPPAKWRGVRNFSVFSAPKTNFEMKNNAEKTPRFSIAKNSEIARVAVR